MKLILLLLFSYLQFSCFSYKSFKVNEEIELHEKRIQMINIIGLDSVDYNYFSGKWKCENQKSYFLNRLEQESTPLETLIVNPTDIAYNFFDRITVEHKINRNDRLVISDQKKTIKSNEAPILDKGKYSLFYILKLDSTHLSTISITDDRFPRTDFKSYKRIK